MFNNQQHFANIRFELFFRLLSATNRNIIFMQLKIVISNQQNPFLNLAVEQNLVKQNPDDTLVMYLWKNYQTVVIGLNQNPYTECNVDTLLSEGGHLMRRLTGGGAVYHDAGNLNFSFIVPKQYYNVPKQFAVIQKALQTFGLQTEISGRNDLLCDGRKFSGNAFATTDKINNLHHGTLLIKTDITKVQKYLKVKPSKLKKHGVASVSSRIVNLSELAAVNSENIVQPLITAFQDVYQAKAQITPFDLVCTPEVIAQSQMLASDDFLFAKWRNFHSKQSASFAWGEVELDITSNETLHCIQNIEIATDCLNLPIIEQAQHLLQGASLEQAPTIPNIENAYILQDIVNLIYTT